MATLFLALGPVAGAWAQDVGITGVVKDSEGGVLPGVSVTATNAGTGLNRTAVTSGDGRYSILGLPAGTYSVKAQLSGFAEFVRTDLKLVVGTTAPVNVTLAPAGVTQELTVTGERTIVETTESDVGTALSDELIENLPVAERNAISLALLVPGVSATPYFDPTKSRDNFDGFGFGANSASENLILVDGGDNNDDVVGSILQFYPQDSIQEYEVITSRFKAEYGHTDGGVVNMITKSGTNTFSGGGYWLFRDDKLNAKTFVEEEADPPVDKAEFRQNVAGGYLGGPVIKDKLFFFGNYDWTKRPQQILPSSGGELAEIDAQGQVPNDFKQTLGVGKVTANLNASNFLTARYAYQDDSTVNANIDASSTTDHAGLGTNTYHAFLLKNQTVIGSDKLNEVFWQYNTFENNLISNAVGRPLENKELAPGIYTLGQNHNHPQQTLQDKHQFQDNFSWRMSGAGDHDFKAGIEYQNVKLGGLFTTGDPFVTFVWNEVESYNAGRLADTASVSNGPAFFIGGGENNIYAFYLQDDWKPTERVTINLGLRYDIETNDWTQSSDKGRLGPGRTFISSDPLYFGAQPETDTNNWGPRVGFAYDVEGTGKFVMRGGYGLYYQQIFWNSPLRYPFLEGDLVDTRFYGAGSPLGPVTFRHTDPFCAPGQTSGGQGCIPVPAVPEANANAFRGLNFATVDPRVKTPYTHQFNAGFSLLLPQDYGLDVDFVHTQSDNQIYRTRVTRGQSSVTGLNTSNLGFRALIDTNGARQVYNGVLLSLRKRYDKLSTQVSYTWGVSKGHIPRQTSPLTVDSAAGFDDNYGWLPGRREHAFAGSVFYSLPYEFQVGAILKFQSGFRFSGLDPQLPDVDADGVRTDNYANRNLGSPCSDCTGDRGQFVGDTYSQVDLRMSKKFTIGGRWQPQIFFEIFNLFNAKNEKVDTVQTNVRSDTFGESNQVAGQPFQGQLSLRLDF